MRSHIRILLVFASILSCGSATAGTIWSTAEALGDNVFRVEYHVNGIEFLKNQELEIGFSASIFRSLFNAVAPAGFNILIFQPNDPFGTDGRLSLLALVDSPPVPDGIRLDVRAVGDIRQLGADRDAPHVQKFAVNQLDDQGVIISRIESGDVAAAIPEPATAHTIVSVVLLAGAFLVCRRGFLYL